MKGWHFPRTELAKQYLGLLELGISSSLAIIAPRRKGKTLFILQDLAPLSEEMGYIPVYASLWQNINAPHEGLITALKAAINTVEKKGRFGRFLQVKVQKAAVSNELLGKMEIEFADSPTKPNSQDLEYLEQLLATLEEKAGEQTILLLVDEVQHLSTSPNFAPLAHTLRTMLDKRQGKVKSIFTGSSRHYLDLLLNESNSPFYHFVDQQNFPDLGASFIEFLQVKLLRDHDTQVDTTALASSFRALDQSPYWMMKLIGQIVTHKQPVNDALEHILQVMEATEDFAGLATRMKPIDKLVFLALCDGKNPYSKEMLAKVDEQTSTKGVGSNIQRSIERLSEAGLISKTGKQGYNIEKPGFMRYIKKSE